MQTDTNAQTTVQTATINAPATDICSVLSVLPKISEYWPGMILGKAHDSRPGSYSNASNVGSSTVSLGIDPHVNAVSTPTATTITLGSNLDGTIQRHLQITGDCSHVSGTADVTRSIVDDLTPDWTDNEPIAAVREARSDT